MSSPAHVPNHTIKIDNPIPTPKSPPPDVLRVAYMEIHVTDLAESRKFYVDTLGLVVTYEDENEIYLRSFEEFIHHNLVLRTGDTAAVAVFSFRVRSQEEVDKAEEYYKALGCETRRGEFTKGIRNEVQVVITVTSIAPDEVYDTVAINAASMSTQLSGLPFSGPIGGVRVALLGNQWVAFPNVEQVAKATARLAR